MPLTLSHPAAVIPLRRLGLPMTALVFGSMVLDVPLYLGSRRGYWLTHSPLGVVTADIVLTLFVLLAWFGFLRDPLVDMSPGALRSRLAARAQLTRRQWILAVPAASIAAATHIVWDSFTHSDRWAAENIRWLQDDHLGLGGYMWAQYLSGVLGLAVVLWFAYTELRSLPPDKPRPPRALGPYALLVAIGVAIAMGVATAIANIPSGLHLMAFHGVINGIIAIVITVGVVSLAWQVAVRRLGRGIEP